MPRSILSLLILAAPIGISPAAPRLKEKEVVYFPMTVDSKWVYQVGDSENVQVVTKVETKEDGKHVHVADLAMDGKSKPAMVVLVNEKGLFLLEETGQPYDPPWQMLKLPAVPGETWDTKTRRPDIGEISETQTTGKPEELVVAAGKLQILPVTVSNPLRGKGVAPAADSVYSYAPGIGWAKIVVGGTTVRELKSFTPAK